MPRSVFGVGDLVILTDLLGFSRCFGPKCYEHLHGRATRRLFVGEVEAALGCLVDLTSAETEVEDGCGMGSFGERIGTALKLDTGVDKVLGGMGTSFTVSIK